jgi:hypothetical protein
MVVTEPDGEPEFSACAETRLAPDRQVSAIVGLSDGG